MIATLAIITAVNSSVSRTTTIPRAMLVPLEEEAWLLHSVVLPSLCDGVTMTVVYTVDVSVVLGDGHEVMGVIFSLTGVKHGKRMVIVEKMEE